MDGDLKGLLFAALQETENASASTALQRAISGQLTNLESQQAVNLLAQHGGGAVQLQVSFFNGSGFSTVVLSIDPEGKGSTSERGKPEPSYNILFLLNLQDLGRIRIDARLASSFLHGSTEHCRPGDSRTAQFFRNVTNIGLSRGAAGGKAAQRNSAGQSGKIRRVGYRSALEDQPARLEGIIMDRHPNESCQVVALRYKPKRERAPKVVAKGRGYLADKIIEIAREHNIPIRQDKNLLQILSRLDLNDEIPTEIYKAVAEILAFIYRLSNRQPVR